MFSICMYSPYFKCPVYYIDHWYIRRYFTCNIDIDYVLMVYGYLGNMISYEGELDIDSKLNNFLKITGILNNVFRP